VVHILDNLNPNLLFDLSKTFGLQKKTVSKRLIPAIKSALNPTMNAYNKEILDIVKQLHKSRREIWLLKEGGKIDAHNKRQHVASRRDQVLY
jgi:hypothetical protein